MCAIDPSFTCQATYLTSAHHSSLNPTLWGSRSRAPFPHLHVLSNKPSTGSCYIGTSDAAPTEVLTPQVGRLPVLLLLSATRPPPGGRPLPLAHVLMYLLKPRNSLSPENDGGQAEGRKGTMSGGSRRKKAGRGSASPETSIRIPPFPS